MSDPAPASAPPELDLTARRQWQGKQWTLPENWNGDDYTGPGLPPWGTKPRCPVVRQGRPRCRKACIPGGAVCSAHGGAAPQVRNRAKLRLLSLVDPALSTLARTLVQSTDDKLKTQIAFGILDRTGLGKQGDVGADVAKAVLMDRFYALRAETEKARAEAGQPSIDSEWVIEADEIPADELEEMGAELTLAPPPEFTEAAAPGVTSPGASLQVVSQGDDGDLVQHPRPTNPLHLEAVLVLDLTDEGVPA